MCVYICILEYVYTHVYIYTCVYTHIYIYTYIYSFGFFLIVMLWATVFCFVSSINRTIWLSPSIIPPVKDPARHVSGMFSRDQGQTEPNSEPTELTRKWSALLSPAPVSGAQRAVCMTDCESCGRNRFLTPLKEKSHTDFQLIYTSFPIYFFPSLYFMWKHFRTCSSHTICWHSPSFLPSHTSSCISLIIGCGGKQG